MAAFGTLTLLIALVVATYSGVISLIGVYGPPFNAVDIGTFMNKAQTMRTGQASVKRYMPHLLEHVRAGRIQPSSIRPASATAATVRETRTPSDPISASARPAETERHNDASIANRAGTRRPSYPGRRVSHRYGRSQAAASFDSCPGPNAQAHITTVAIA